MRLPGEHTRNGKQFSPHYPQNTPPSQNLYCGHAASSDTPVYFISVRIKYNLILLSKNKDNRTIASYRRYYCLYSLNCSLRLLSPLVFTVAAFEISLFQGPEKQYQRFEKVQVSKIFQGLALHPQNPQLNDSLLVSLRSLRSTKNSELFSNSYFAP